MSSSGARRLYELLDSLIALRIEFAEGTEGDKALVDLGRGKAHAVRTIMDTAITSTKRIIGEMPRPLLKNQ